MKTSSININEPDNLNCSKEHVKDYGFEIKCMYCGEKVTVPFGNSLSTNNELITINTEGEGIIIVIKCERCGNETTIRLFDIIKDVSGI